TRVHQRSAPETDMTFSNAASCIRRSAWEAHPFTLPIAEDVEWANWAIADGLKIVYEAGVSAYHSHNDTCRQNAVRAIQFEKGNDLAKGRNRTFALTLRQTLGRAKRDLQYVLRLPDPKPGRLALIWDCFAGAYWFFRESRRDRGTTPSAALTGLPENP